MRFLVIIVGVLFLTACVSAPTQEQIDNADFGPKPDNPEKLAEDWLTSVLIDPESARFNHGDFFKGYADYKEGSIGVADFGWMQCGTVNAKNRMGGYTGSTPYYVLIKNGEVKRGEIGDEDLHVLYVDENCDNVIEE